MPDDNIKTFEDIKFWMSTSSQIKEGSIISHDIKLVQKAVKDLEVYKKALLLSATKISNIHKECRGIRGTSTQKESQSIDDYFANVLPEIYVQDFLNEAKKELENDK